MYSKNYNYINSYFKQELMKYLYCSIDEYNKNKNLMHLNLSCYIN